MPIRIYSWLVEWYFFPNIENDDDMWWSHGKHKYFLTYFFHHVDQSANWLWFYIDDKMMLWGSRSGISLPEIFLVCCIK